MTISSATTRPWHALDTDSVFHAVNASIEGLTQEEADSRLAINGLNALPSAPPPPWWLIGLRQFKNPLIYILVLAAVVSVVIGHLNDAAFIAVVLALNATIGGFQEWRAERSAEALQKLLKIVATVVRDGQVCEVEAQRVVPGDIVWLESGNRVPADMRLLQMHGLEIDESLLTGESLAVAKNPKWQGLPDMPLADRQNMAYAGSVVTRGRAKGVVVATGIATHVGRLAMDVIATGEGRPPLLVRLERFTKVIGLVVLVAVALICLIGVLLDGQDISSMFFFGVALAVSAIPEGLPVAITVALAVATTRMARRGVIVRKLGAVEGLGSCTHIASDKTGTLTCNELTVRQLYLVHEKMFDVTGQGFTPVGQINHQGRPIDDSERKELTTFIQAGALCNEADLHKHNGKWAWRGDPTDIALLTLAGKMGVTREATLDAMPQINQIPFEPEYQFAASYHQAARTATVFVKGAPERVFAMCRDTTPALAIDMARDAAERMANEGCRVLALATASIEKTLAPTEAPHVPSGLSLLGLVGMIDPLRPGVREAITTCQKAGITALMVTGDHPVTALAIGRELGLADQAQQVINGAQLEGLSDQQLEHTIVNTRIFARVAPHQKLRIVEATQRLGHFVAVTGDGVNDAPALRKANIGVAMGRSGTDVAREASDIVISDDNFTTIVAGVEEGRIAYNNIRNVIYLLITTGAAEVILVVLSFACGLPLPLLPVQLLWLNLVTNGIQDVALAFEPAEGNELQDKPRPPREHIFNRLMIERTLTASLVMGIVAFGAFVWMLRSGWEETAARNALLLLMVLFENVHIGNCRSETRSAFHLSPLRSPILLAGAIAAFTIHIAVMYTPVAQSVLATQPVGLTTWLTLFVLALTVLAAIEIHKWVWSRRHIRSQSQNT